MMYDVHPTGDGAGAAERTRVLIVGGGLVGLCASLFLSHQGVESVLAERRTTTSPQPKARRISIRTMELFRQAGIDDAVAKAAAALADFQRMSAGPTLALAQPLPFRSPGGNPDWADCSPVSACLCAQDTLEPVLRGLAADRGGDVRFGTEVVDTSQDPDGVTATLRGPGGELSRIRADYLIAADGARSPVRERLGIPRTGRGIMRRVASVYLRADLTDLIRGREFNLCQVEQPAVPASRGTFASVNGTDRWIFTTAPGPDRGVDEWRAITQAAIGASGIPVSVETVQEWDLAQLVADRFSQGRIFLAGDAAHVMPPFAALGANTGIQDAHNLAWKLAHVIGAAAGPELLDSYHAERHPAAWFAARQSLARTPNLREMQTTSADGSPLADPMALTLGFQYPAGAFIGDGSTAAVDRLDLRGQPGTRLPHRWLPGRRRSTLDLVGRQLTLLTGPDGAAWPAALSQPGLTAEQVELPDWGASVGTGDGGALLVRPDQVVAWRHHGRAADPRGELAAALARLLGRTAWTGPAAGGRLCRRRAELVLLDSAVVTDSTPGELRVRFAPSPTGYLHVGGARSALVNWVLARQSGGALVLRIEDTDAERNRPEWTEGIISALAWLGMTPDQYEGPFLQSEYLAEHQAAAQRLYAEGQAYYCDCTREAIVERTGDPHRGYDGFCRDRGLGPGEGRALRFRTPDEGTTVVDDLVRGKTSFENSTLEDFVIARANGSVLFLLANVVDDMSQRITLVARAEEHLSNTPKQQLLWAALGHEPPAWAHLSILVNEKRQKLSKRRDTHVSVEDFRDDGYLPEAMRNYLMLLGWAPRGDREIVSWDTIVAEFRIEDVNPSPAFFDVKKLRAFNGEYIRALAPGDFARACQPWLEPPAAPWPADRFDPAVFTALAPLAQTRVSLLSEITNMVDFAFLDEPAVDEASWTKAMKEPAEQILADAQTAYETVPWQADELKARLEEIGTSYGMSLGKTQAPVRVAVTGRTVGLPLFESLQVLGRERTLLRIQRARERLAGLT